MVQIIYTKNRVIVKQRTLIAVKDGWTKVYTHILTMYLLAVRYSESKKIDMHKLLQ